MWKSSPDIHAQLCDFASRNFAPQDPPPWAVNAEKEIDIHTEDLPSFPNWVVLFITGHVRKKKG